MTNKHVKRTVREKYSDAEFEKMYIENTIEEAAKMIPCSISHFKFLRRWVFKVPQKGVNRKIVRTGSR